MSELFPPAVARFTSDATPFIEGLAKANGATRDWQAELAKAGTAAQKAGTTAEAASNRAATAMRRAADAAAQMAKANGEAAVAAQKLATGELSQEEAAGAATKASRAQTTALEAQQRASVATQRAAAASADATRASAGVQTASAAKSNAAWASVSTGLNKVGKGATIALAAIGIASIHMAGNFQQQTNVLVTAAGELPKNLGLVRDGILNIAETTGTAWQDVTAGVYVAEKAGFRGADALNVVKASAQGAREEQANLATVLNATTSVMASYHLKASDAVSVTNQIKTAAGESKTTMEQFAGSLSTVLPIASAAGISFPQVAGALATLTQHGTTANEATQELAGTIKALANPNAVAVNEMQQLGISAVSVQQNLGKKGLSGTLEDLSNTVLSKMGPAGTLLLSTFNSSKLAAADAQTELEHLPSAAQKVAQAYENGSITLKDYRTDLKGLTGPQASLAQQFVTTENKAKGFQSTLRAGGSNVQTYIGAIAKLTGGTTGLNTLLQLTGGSAGGLTERIGRVGDAAKGAGKDVSGWASTQKLFNVKLDEFKQQAEATGIKIGEQLIPPLQTVLGLLTRHPAVLHDVVTGLELMSGAWVAMKIAGWISSLNTLAGRLLGVSGAARTAAVSTDALATAEGLAGRAGAVEGAGAALGAGAAARSLPAMGGDLVAAAGAGAGLRGGLSKLAAIPLLRVAVPLAITYEVINQAGLKKQFEDILSGQFQKAANDSPAWEKKLVINVANVKLSGTVTGSLAEGSNVAENWVKAALDSGKINTFQAALKNATADLNSNTNSLTDNTVGAVSNRKGLADLAVKAQVAAQAYQRTTGQTGDYTKALGLGVSAILNSASATGLNRQQVANYLNTLIKIPGFKVTTIGLDGTAAAQAQVKAFLDSLAQIPKQISVPVTAFLTNPDVANQLAGSAFGIDTTGAPKSTGKAAGGMLHGPGSGTSDSMLARVSNGEYVVRAASVKQYGVGFFDSLNAGRYAAGGAVDTNSFLSALALTANLASLEKARVGFNQAHFAHATAANVPGLELASEHAAQSAALVGNLFGSHKAALYKAAHTGSAAQRKIAGGLFNTLQARSEQLNQSAALEAGMLATLQRRYAGQEALTATPGPATRDLSYLALSGAPTTTAGPSHVNVTVVSQLDGKEIARSTSKVQLRTEKRNLSNGATKIRNR